MADLHSMGQFIQEGSRIMFETIVDVKKPAQDLFIEELKGNFDGLNFLADQNMSVVNPPVIEIADDDYALFYRDKKAKRTRLFYKTALLLWKIRHF